MAVARYGSPTPTPDAQEQAVIDELLVNWGLDDILQALPNRLEPTRSQRPRIGQRPNPARWGLDLLTHLRDLSALTPGKESHQEVLRILADRIDFRRASKALARPHTHEGWTIVADVQHAIKEYTKARARDNRRSLRISNAKAAKTMAVRNTSKSSAQTATGETNPSRKRKTTQPPQGEDEDEFQGSLYSGQRGRKRPAKRYRSKQRSSTPLYVEVDDSDAGSDLSDRTSMSQSQGPPNGTPVQRRPTAQMRPFGVPLRRDRHPTPTESEEVEEVEDEYQENAEDEDQEEDSVHLRKRRCKGTRGRLQYSRSRSINARSSDEAGSLGGIKLPGYGQWPGNAPSQHAADDEERLQHKPIPEQEASPQPIQDWRNNVPSVAPAVPPTIASLSDRVADINFEFEYPLPRNATREQRINYLKSLRRRNIEFGSARVENTQAQAERRHAQAYRHNAQAEAHGRDGRDAEFDCRIQIEEVSPVQSEEQEEEEQEQEDQSALSGPSTRARMGAIIIAAQAVLEEQLQEGETGSAQ